MNNTTMTNLDDIDSYVPFIFQAHEYQFWFPTTVESLEAQKIKDDNEKFQDYILGLVHIPKGADYPEFKDVFGAMNAKQVSSFYKMINAEIGLG
jgi:hypothetical protein